MKINFTKIFIVLLIFVAGNIMAQQVPAEVENAVKAQPANAGNIYLQYAKKYASQNKTNESVACYKKAAELYKQGKQTEGEAYCYNKIGKVYSNAKKHNEAIKAYKKALDLYSSANNTKSAYNAAYNIGNEYFVSGNFKQAAVYYKKAYNLIANSSDYKEQAYVLNQLGASYANYGDFTSGLKYFNKAAKMAEKSGESQLLANINSQIKAIEGNKEHHEKAKTEYEKEQEQEQKQLVENLKEEYSDIKNKHLMSLKEIEHLSYENQAKELKLHVIKEKYEKQLLENQLKEQKIKLLKSENELKEKRVKLLEAENQIKELKIGNQRKIITIISISLGIVIILLIIIIFLFVQRTKTLKLLKEKNAIIDEKNQELNQQNEEIATQRDELERQRDILNKQNKEITDSIKYAKRIQNSILPARSVISNFITDFFVLFKPKNIVSGDFYWFIQTSENVAWGAVVDCTGHGVPGAFMSMIGNSLLNKIVLEQHTDKPSEVLSRLNRELSFALNQNKDEETSDDGMDMTVCKIDLNNKKITLAFANHSAIIVEPGKKPEVVEGDIFSIGGMFAEMDDIEFTDIQVDIKQGLSIYMYSDGFQDQFGGDENKKYTRERMVQNIEKISSENMPKQGEFFEKEFENWKGFNEQIDDVLIVGVKF